MIVLAPIVLYILLPIFSIAIVNYLAKNNKEYNFKRIKKTIILLFLALFLPFLLIYFSYLFSISLDDHYDIKKGTFLWYLRMDNKTITQFPVILPIGKATYNSIGGDSPSIGAGWEIIYYSAKDKKILVKEILTYLNNRGFSIKEVNSTQCYWKGRFIKNDTSQLYNGTNKNGECLDIIFQKDFANQTKITCSIIL